MKERNTFKSIYNTVVRMDAGDKVVEPGIFCPPLDS